jgi:gamma-glutamyl-gamma-aminobutyrate hydrolase PuuD
MKCVVVSQRVDVLPDRNEIRDALDQRLTQFIAVAGGLVMPVPNIISADHGLNVWLAHIQPDAVVLSGGNDIGDRPERDMTEKALLEYARSKHVPVLGICRGMQMMAHVAGVVLVPVSGHVRIRHQLTGSITGSVNSYHNIALSACPKGFTVLARSEDGEIEAIRHEHLPWEGWMWHPERDTEFDDRDVLRLKNLLHA